MKWYKRDPDAWLGGVVALTPEERGVYDTVIDLLYSRDGLLPDDDQFFGRACNCNPRTWRRIRDSLIQKGKLHYESGTGQLMANRVRKELESASKRIAKMSQLNEIRWKNNECDAPLPDSQPQPQPQPQPEKKEDKKNEDYAFAYGVIRLSDEHYQQWKRAYSSLDLDAELTSIEPWAAKQENWFMAVSAALRKKHINTKTAKEKHQNGQGPFHQPWSSAV